MNIAIGKSGRSMKFNKAKWSIFSGDDSPMIIYFELAKRYPQHTFYIIGASDFLKYKMAGNDVPDNIVDLWGEAKLRQNSENIHYDYKYQMILDYVKYKNVKLDLGIIMQGPDMSYSIQGIGCRTKKDLTKEPGILEMAKGYIAPIQSVINDQGFPWFLINEDPRYVPFVNMDIINDEKLIFSQINCVKRVKRISGYYDKATILRDYDERFVYAGTERMFLADFKKVDFTNPMNIKVGDKIYQKKNPFILTVNGGGGHGGKDRLKFVEEWVLKFHPEQIIYGKWSDRDREKYPNTFIERGIVDLQDEMWESMFTYIPGFDKSVTNFVTQKVWKMLYYGIIPFWDKNAYDTDNLLKFPDIVKVNSPKEMWERIEYFKNNPVAYEKCLKWAYSKLEDKYFNGDFIDEIFGKIIKKYEK